MSIKSKNCSKCHIYKDILEFHKNKTISDGFHHKCKLCKSIDAHNYYINNIEERKLAWKKYYNNNKEKQKIKRDKWYVKNKDIANERSKEYRKKKFKENVQYKLKHYLRTRLKHALREKLKTGSAVRELGCTGYELKQYLESKFQAGMTWDNWSQKGWHVDHIKPLSSFDLSNPEQFKQAVHYTNLQPLWAKDNLKKSNKIE